MASFSPIFSPSLPILFLLLLLLAPSIAEDGFEMGEEMKTHLHFFFHDIVTGPSPTAMRVAESKITNTSPTGFGAVVMMDDPLTEGPESDSKIVGHAQGMYALASLDEVGHLLMAMNLAFVDGEFNGSTITVMGRNSVFNDVREMPVVGGSGKFRFARGYALARTHTLEMLTGNAVVEYDVYVLHH
ncbi:dirigent protein 22 [Elaeis guineensis]|uniref:Dirigent protein n=1 Tax=Elaeis guineensis var. tenera TaxID=51953 RepID=A0A6I9QLS9_ELAGV|nr:dirigent protein 22 [Elaeis guineensis]